MRKLIVLLSLLLISCGTPSTVGGTYGLPSPCPANPLANVYHPQRLQVRTACQTVSGTVLAVLHEADGDWHLWLKADAQYAGLLNAANVYHGQPALVVEVVPADQPGCVPGKPPRPPEGTKDYGVCTGRALAEPKVRQHISVVGTYNLDREHGWMEVHPVWVLTVLAGVA